MSSEVNCDQCKQPGRRRYGQISPEDWLFLEARDDGADDPEESTIVVYACSKECALLLWQKGPGTL